ncbi:hypothetical protein CI109_106089 [Kwoniella shandongensis]|uniref:Uncharacterized protein n=1 Tax=Kwoniella shandongensis TaxID=1734106 RepID=A0A5M6BTG6_9TREE|nr:uncharacterized protein CI109_006373 [Kwoniella shandongensis]KAA5525302.1 hypothetical protein CI109_006373 [Kwoniella shandongensis]
MCHETPTSQFLGSLITIFGSWFMAWHIYKYDKGRCLVLTRKSAFRWIIVWMFIVAMVLFMIYTVTLTYIKYDEWYTVLPTAEGHTEIMPTPFTRWSSGRQKLVSTCYQLLSAALALNLSIHCEETLYWAYLIGTIRRRDSKSWFSSVNFKLWVGFCVFSMALLFGVANIETKHLIQMERNVIFAGATTASVLLIGSVWLTLVFPGFIQESRRQGANPDVIARLQFFKELNELRTLFRFLYVACLLAVSGDGFTRETPVNTHPFSLDLLFIAGFFFVFISNSFSLMILLPRNTYDSASPSQEGGVFVRRPPVSRAYNQRPRSGPEDGMIILPSNASSINSASGTKKAHTHYSDMETHLTKSSSRPNHNIISPSTSRFSQSPWGILGDRLNIHRSAVEDLELQQSYYNTNDQRRMEEGRSGQRCPRTAGEAGGDDDEDCDKVGQESGLSITLDAPFAPTGGERMLSQDEIEARVEPDVLNNFRSPVDIVVPAAPRDLNIVVVTSTVVEKT